nr:MAG TPA: Cytosine specific methyltransferase [Caudoviricetes sp.]
MNNHFFHFNMLNQINHLDLFSGLGGFSVGLKKACENTGIHYNKTLFSEIKSSAIKSLKHNFDVTNELPLSIVDLSQKIHDNPNYYHFNFLTAGFPCQPFSVAGNREGFSDKYGRGEMFFHIIDILKQQVPQYIILENVPNLETHDNGNTFKVILEELDKCGYMIDYHVFDSKDFQLVQHRKRIFIYGIHKSYINPNKLDSTYKQLKQIKDVTKPSYYPTFKDIMQDTNVVNQQYIEQYRKSLKDSEKYFIQILLNYVNKYNIDLSNKYINDKRGGDRNIHSWDLEYFGKIVGIEKELLNLILFECRKKSNDRMNTNKTDGIPLLIQVVFEKIQNNDTLKHLNIDELTDMLNHLEELGYLNTHHYLEHPVANKRTSALNSQVKQWIKKGYNEILDENGQILKGYSVITNKLRFPFYTFITEDSVLKTLTATDAIKVGVVDKSNNIIRKLTKRELLDSLGYPKDYNLDNFEEFSKEIYDLCGNSLAVPIVQYIATQMLTIPI